MTSLISRMCAPLGLAIFLLTANAQAHHSLAAFDKRKTITLTAVVRVYRWLNPHVLLDIEDEQHKQWSLEMSAPNVMLDEGWARDTLTAGDRITLVANPPAKGMSSTNKLLYVGLVLPSGKTLGKTGAP